MGDFNRAPFIIVDTTFTVALAGGVVQKNIVAANLPAAQRDRIPPRLRNSLRGTIEFISMVHTTTGASPQTEVMFFGTDVFLNSANVTQIEFLGMQKVAGGDWDTTATTHNTVDAENMGIFYRDKDNTGEFHVRVETAATGPPDTIALLRFLWRPEIGAP